MYRTLFWVKLYESFGMMLCHSKHVDLGRVREPKVSYDFTVTVSVHGVYVIG